MSRNKREGLYMGNVGGHRRTHEKHASLRYFVWLKRKLFPRPTVGRGTGQFKLPE